MTPEQYKAIRLRLGLSQEMLARRLEVARRTIIRREQGQAKVNKEAEYAIKYVQEGER